MMVAQKELASNAVSHKDAVIASLEQRIGLVSAESSAAVKLSEDKDVLVASLQMKLTSEQEVTASLQRKLDHNTTLYDSLQQQFTKLTNDKDCNITSLQQRLDVLVADNEKVNREAQDEVAIKLEREKQIAILNDKLADMASEHLLAVAAHKTAIDQLRDLNDQKSTEIIAVRQHVSEKESDIASLQLRVLEQENTSASLKQQLETVFLEKQTDSSNLRVQLAQKESELAEKEITLAALQLQVDVASENNEQAALLAVEREKQQAHAAGNANFQLYIRVVVAVIYKSFVWFNSV
jgi:hypothetical protein